MLTATIILGCCFGLYASMCQLPRICDTFGDRAAGISLGSFILGWPMLAVWLLS